MKMWKSVVAVCLFIIPAVSSQAFAESDCGAAVRTEQGPVVGAPDKVQGACVYKGIPYAAPPVGELRWRPPEPPAGRDNVLEAKEFSPQCLQPPPKLLDEKMPSSEDCLYLNVWTPAAKGKFPVMLWIHGGGFVSGSGANSTYSGGHMAANEGVIVVTINYRLGPFGFLVHPALIEESPNRSSGNYGLLDQIQALKWVKANIAAFGGDPDKVTLIGQSAGACSVCALMVSPLAAGLFQRAIMESGSCEMLDDNEVFLKTGAELVDKLGCGDGDTMACMRSKPADKVLAAANAKIKATASGGLALFKWWANIDGWVIEAKPLDLLRSGKFNRVPLLLGSNHDELKLFTPSMPGWLLSMPEFLIKLYVKRSMGKDVWETIEKYYPPKNYSKPIYAVLYFAGDLMFGIGMLDAARAVSEYGKVFYYRFDYDEHTRKDSMGAAHCFEIPFIFDTFGAGTKLLQGLYREEQLEAAQPLSKIMMKYWADFARTGDPNGEGLAEWPAFNTESRQRIILDVPLSVEPEDWGDRYEDLSKHKKLLMP